QFHGVPRVFVLDGGRFPNLPAQRTGSETCAHSSSLFLAAKLRGGERVAGFRRRDPTAHLAHDDGRARFELAAEDLGRVPVRQAELPGHRLRLAILLDPDHALPGLVALGGARVLAATATTGSNRLRARLVAQGRVRDEQRVSAPVYFELQ